MKKLVPLALVVLSFGFSGCVSPGNQWNLADPAQATVVAVQRGYETRDDGCDEFYVVVFEHMERRAKVRVEKDAFDSVRKGDKAEIELMSVTLTEDDMYLLEVEYCWHVGGKDYPVIFKCDAKERPTRPVPSVDKS